MDELTCQFSPLVYAELYRLLAATPALEDSLTYRLQELNYPFEWLNDAADAYRAKWEYDLSFADADCISDFVVEQPDHALLATWLLAGLRYTGPCYELSYDLATVVLEKATGAVRDLGTPLPPSLSPVVIGWTLGQLIGSYDLPAAPAQPPDDDNVRAAFLGLVEHVLLLQKMAEPWPEMMCMATYWRGYGLAEGMLPELNSGGPALDQLLKEARLSMDSGEYGHLHRHFQHFNRRRQAVSHIADDHSRPRYVEVIETIKDWSDLRMTVQGLTQYVFQEVSKSLADSRIPSSLRRDPWAHLLPEIRADW